MTVFRHVVAVITGGAGTGKTTLLRVVVITADELGISTTLLAPTGKAAARLARATGREAMTVHRFLAQAANQTRDRARLPVGLVIVDEASMLDLETTARLTEFLLLGKGPRMLLVGDDNQLPSVGPGRVLSDLIHSKAVAVARLTKNVRQGRRSEIVRQAERVKQGLPLDRNNTIDFKLVLLSEEPERACGEATKALWRVMEEERTSIIRRVDAKPFNPFLDIQVLTPTNAGPLGVNAMNTALRTYFQLKRTVGPHIGGGQRVQEGDRVICTRNDYSVGSTGIFNGEQGVVQAFTQDSVTLKMHDGRQLVLVGSQISSLMLAYAITVHKAQGSDYPIAIIVLHRSHGRMVSRQLLYTALTRAQDRAVLCADRRTLAMLTEKRTDPFERATALSQILTAT